MLTSRFSISKLAILTETLKVQRKFIFTYHNHNNHFADKNQSKTVEKPDFLVFIRLRRTAINKDAQGQISLHFFSRFLKNFAIFLKRPLLPQKFGFPLLAVTAIDTAFA